MAIMIPVTVLFMWGSADVVRVVYQGGQFDANAVGVVSQVQWFSLLMVPFAVVLLIAQRLSTALGASGLILRAGFGAMLVNMTGDWFLPRWLGVGGIALASASGYIVFVLTLAGLLYLREPRLFRTVTR
jgi:peptidoglycan biosynthesis protein MviN/MurJ (putative lipid II flippase)